MPAVGVIKHPALAAAVTPRRPAAREPCGLPCRVAPAQQKKTPGEAPGVGVCSLFDCPPSYQRRKRVAKLVHPEGEQREAEKGG